MSLIDAEYLIEHVCACMENDRLLKTATKDEILRMIEDVPSAEPEVIRCKDCKYYYNVMHGGTQFEYGKCCRTFVEDVKPDDYCSKGERNDT